MFPSLRGQMINQLLIQWDPFSLQRVYGSLYTVFHNEIAAVCNVNPLARQMLYLRQSIPFPAKPYPLKAAQMLTCAGGVVTTRLCRSVAYLRVCGSSDIWLRASMNGYPWSLLTHSALPDLSSPATANRQAVIPRRIPVKLPRAPVSLMSVHGYLSKIDQVSGLSILF